jgi:hypothetical protein
VPSDQPPGTIPAARPMPLASTANRDRRRAPRRAVQNCAGALCRVPETHDASFCSAPPSFPRPLLWLRLAVAQSQQQHRPRPRFAAPSLHRLLHALALRPPPRARRGRLRCGARTVGACGPVVKRPATSVPLDVCPLPRRRHFVRTPPAPQLLLASSLRVWFARLLSST